MLSEALTTLLEREWLPAETAHTATPEQRARLWSALQEFFDARSSAPSSCAWRPGCSARTWSAYRSAASSRSSSSAAALRSACRHRAWTGAGGDRAARRRRRTSSTPPRSIASRSSRRAAPIALVAAAAATIEPAASLDIGTPHVHRRPPTAGELASRLDVARLTAIGALLAAAESVGAAERMLADACALRGRAPPVRPHDRLLPGAAPHPGRHVRAPASAWSTVLYAAAALDDELPDAQRTAAIAKAYVARAAREVAHGALQVFGGIAFTEEHQAHRFLRRIIVREQQFGDAAHHERELGRGDAPRGAPGAVSWSAHGMTETGFNDPTAQRLERITTGADPEVVGPLLADVLHDPRWLELRRRADLRRQVEPDLSGRLATPARSSCAARRSGTSCPPRTTWAASTACSPRSTAPPCPCRARCTSATESSARRST